MKLCSIISTWADTICLLPFCIKNHLQFCDGVLVIWSQHSNHWEKNDAVLEYILANGHDSRVEFVQLEPMKGQKPLFNETRKRNHGIDIAREKGFTHFLVADADEFYDPGKMDNDKLKFEDSSLNGFVHAVWVYIKSPTLYTNDNTLVCGIHKLNKDTCAGSFRSYPFAYDIHNQANIDPSRRLSFTKGIKLSKYRMHHFSYIRKNIDLKIDNSSANLKRSRQIIYDELRDAKPGYLSKLYHQNLQQCDNYFGIEI